MPNDSSRRRSSTAAVKMGGEVAFYFLCLAFLAGGIWLTANLLRSPTGRAWVAIRDSEIAAQSMGVNLAVSKTKAFAYSAGLMGVAGALFGLQQQLMTKSRQSTVEA
jgi:ABC-type branched-subunit amino acid transport system permease subunit